MVDGDHDALPFALSTRHQEIHPQRQVISVQSLTRPRRLKAFLLSVDVAYTVSLNDLPRAM
jgi:hypothetical protein